MKSILLLGSNIGDRVENINTAIEKLQNLEILVQKKSKILTTAPLEFVSNNFFCNIALLIETQYSPIKLLDCVKKIEYEMGRKVDSVCLGTYSDRIIDIDIVTYENLIFISKKLCIPHQKHLYQREFSRELICDLA